MPRQKKKFLSDEAEEKQMKTHPTTVYHFVLGSCPFCRGIIKVRYTADRKKYEWKCRECGAYARHKEQETRE